MTGLPLALRDLGPWVGTNAIYLIGVFGLPRLVRRRRTAGRVKLAAIALGIGVFLYANYGLALVRMVPFIPPSAVVLGQISTFTLLDATVTGLLALINRFLTGPILVGPRPWR